MHLDRPTRFRPPQHALRTRVVGFGLIARTVGTQVTRSPNTYGPTRRPRAFPELEGAIEDKELYTPKDVSNLTRESVLPGHGGETIGLGQIVGQCGPNKPSVRAPVEGGALSADRRLSHWHCGLERAARAC